LDHGKQSKLGIAAELSYSNVGLSNVLAKKPNFFGIEPKKQNPAARQIQRLKELEGEGYQFEAAEASLIFISAARRALDKRKRQHI